MLTVSNELTFPAPCQIRMRAFKADFVVRCRLLPVDELDELRKKGAPDAEGKIAMTDREFVNAWLVGFEESVVDKQGQQIPFTPDGVTQLLNMPGALRAVIDGFYNGYADEEEKN